MLTVGPVGVGTRWRESRVLFKKEVTEEIEITAYTPGRSYTAECNSCGCHFSTQFRFAPEGDGTRVEAEMKTKARTFMAKLFSSLSCLMMGSMKKCFAKDFDDLKQAIETGTPSAESTAS